MDNSIGMFFLLVTIIAIIFCLLMVGTKFSWDGGQSLTDNSYYYGQCHYTGFQIKNLNIEWTASRDCPNGK